MISISGRVILNVESLNNVENLGNLVRHRTVPFAYKAKDGTYQVTIVPAISGETIAHSYQMHLAAIGEAMGLPVGKYSKKGELMKFTNDTICKEEGIEPPKKTGASSFEVSIMNKDIVSDVGGFMYAGSPPVRRTSLFKTSYMIPSVVNGNVSSLLESQFHVRFFDPSNIKSEKNDTNQSIFNVETSSTLYSFTFILDESLIGVPTIREENIEMKNIQEEEKKLDATRKERVKAAIKALYPVITMSTDFGAKGSRYYPNPQLQSLVCSHTKFPFVPEPSHDNDYIKQSVSRVEKAGRIFSKGSNKDYSMYVLDKEDITESSLDTKIEKIDSVEDLIIRLLEGQENAI